MKKMFNSIHYQRNVNQKYNKISPHTDQNGHNQKIDNKCYKGCGEKTALLHC